MADQVPIKGIFNGSGDPTGLAEFTTSDTIGYADGGTGLNTLGTAGQILKVNSGATALEWGSIVATIDIDNATDLTSSTLVSSDQILISDGGTEGRVTLSQLDTLFSGTTQTLTNKTFDANGTGNSISNIEVADFASGVVDTDLATVSASDDTLASAKAIKTYVDSQVTAQDLDFQGDSGGALSIDLDSETLTIAGGTGINTSGATNTLTVGIDNTVVATLSDTQTLTNKTINLSSNTLTGTTAQFNTALSDGSFATLAGTETLTNKTLTSPVIAEITSGADIDLTATNDVNIPADVGLTFGDDGEKIEGNGTDLTISSSRRLKIREAGQIDFIHTTGSDTTYLVIDQSGYDARFISQVQDKDIIFQGNDGGSTITALTLDMSEAGNATFNNNVTVGNDLTVTGNLIVSGTTTTVNTETINLADNTITLNSNETGTPSQDGGIEIERGTSTNKTLIWNETTDKWTVGSETFVAGTFEGALTGNVTGDVTGDVTGNADTATALETARTIAGQSFDGTADITIASTDLSDTSNVTLNNATQTLTNKTIDASSNTISNIGNSSLTSGIDAAKISSGSVSNTEFDYLDGVTSSIQTQLDDKASKGFAIAMAIAL